VTFHSALYRGEVIHARHDELRRTFAYPVYMAAIDLDELPALDRELRLFSHGGRNLFALHDRDYRATLAASTAAPVTDLRASLAALLAGNDLPAPHATRLITNLRVAGYVFNPVSFFLNYGAAGELASVIAEVNNTYGGSARYVLGPRERVAGGGRAIRFRHARQLFVSPFLHGPASYEFSFDAPLDAAHLEIAMRVTDDDDTQVFHARLAGDAQPLSDRALAAAAVRYPLMTAQVIGLIHWQALKLRLLGAPYRRPDRDHRPHPAVSA
jgi:DUF1365 family protein